MTNPASHLQISPSPRASTIRHSRRWLFRLAAIALGLSPLILIDSVLSLPPLHRILENFSADAAFSRVHPLFQRAGDKYITASNRRTYFAEASFPARKSPGVFRVFCLGGSTVQGSPFSTATAFPKWLELALPAADPSRKWEVINCGGVSYASYRLIPILRECLNYAPDLVIICTGHNEFLEDRCYGPSQIIPENLDPAWDWIRRRPVVTGATMLASQFLPSFNRQRRPLFKEETDPLLNYHNGLAAYRRDPDHAASVVRHFGKNLEYMVTLSRSAGVRVLLIEPPCNLADSPPFKSVPSPELTEDQAREFSQLLTAARNDFGSNLPSACRLLERACSLDPLHAGARYELARCQLAQRNSTDARDSFVRARDLDVCPLRMTTDLQLALRRVAKRARAPLLDAHELLESKTPDGILGGFLLVDHVHPSFEGHQQIAQMIIDHLAETGVLQPSPGWKESARQCWSEHFARLPASYFHQGQRHLKALRLWTQGKSAGPEIAQHYPHRLDPRLPRETLTNAP